MLLRYANMRLLIWILYSNPQVVEIASASFSKDQVVFFRTFKSVVDAMRLIDRKEILPPKFIITEACVARSEIFINQLSIYGIILATTYCTLFEDTSFCVLNTDCETILEFPSYILYRQKTGLFEGVHYCTQYQLIQEISIQESTEF